MYSMKLRTHLAIIAAAATGIAYYLYSYKQRDLTGMRLVWCFVANISLWMILIGIPWLCIVLLTKAVMRRLNKR